MHAPLPITPRPPRQGRHARMRWLRPLSRLGPVAACTVLGLVLALRAMPLPGAARLVYAAAVALNVALLAAAVWSGILAAVRRRVGRLPFA